MVLLRVYSVVLRCVVSSTPDQLAHFVLGGEFSFTKNYTQQTEHIHMLCF